MTGKAEGMAYRMVVSLVFGCLTRQIWILNESFLVEVLLEVEESSQTERTQGGHRGQAS